MATENIKPVVLIIVDGFGLSANWRGNAVAAAEPKNFLSYWNNYQHLVLQEKQQGLSDAYTKIATGEPHIGSFRLSQELLSQNQDFVAAIDNMKRNNASLQLFVQISRRKKNEIIANLFEMTKFAKRNGVINLFAHLFFDSSILAKNDAEEVISAIEDVFRKNDYGQTASLCGCGYIKERGVTQTLNLVCSGKGKTALSAKQALSLQQKIDAPAKLVPALVKSRHSSRLNNFDLVFSLSVPNDQLTDILRETILTSGEGSGRAASFVSFWAIAEFPFDLHSKINFFFKKNAQSYLSSILHDDKIQQVLITDRHNFDNLVAYYLGGVDFVNENIVPTETNLHTKKLLSTTKKITDLAIKAIGQSQYQFITVNFPMLYRIAKNGTFQEIVDEVKVFDESLEKIVQATFDVSGVAVLCSSCGGAENTSISGYDLEADTTKGLLCHLPFVVISEETEDKTKEAMVQEIVDSSANLTNVFDALKILLLEGNEN